jgi:hypothetical protein
MSPKLTICWPFSGLRHRVVADFGSGRGVEVDVVVGGRTVVVVVDVAGDVVVSGTDEVVVVTAWEVATTVVGSCREATTTTTTPAPIASAEMIATNPARARTDTGRRRSPTWFRSPTTD